MNKHREILKGFVIACSFLVVLSFLKVDAMAFIQKTGTIIEETSLYESASDTATSLMELEVGKEVTVNNQVDDSSGRIWYQLVVDSSTYGYVKAEVVSTSTTGEDVSSEEATVEDTEEEVQTTVTYETYIQLVGTTGGSSVNMRKEASTSTDVVTSLSAGTTFDIIGETTGTDNYVWYQVQIELDGQTLQGYVRSDLATTSEEERQKEVIVEVTPETEATPQEEVIVSPYDIVQGADEDGEVVWYLTDDADSQYEITSLLASEGKSGAGIGMMIFMVILILLVGFLGFLAYTFYSRLVEAEDYLYDLKQKKEQNKKVAQKKAQEPEKKSMVHLSKPDLPPMKDDSPIGKPVTVSSKPTVTDPKTTAGKQTPPKARPGNKPPVRQTQKAKPSSYVEPAMKNKIEVQSPKETYTNSTIKTPEYNYLPKSEDIIEATSRDLESRFSEDKVKPAKTGWKSKNFLTDDDDDLDFNFLKFDDDK
ncbi:MAG: SH3 domain-containing protein [Lachnospiraceae bacterium]